jgi:hypothetical protein
MMLDCRNEAIAPPASASSIDEPEPYHHHQDQEVEAVGGSSSSSHLGGRGAAGVDFGIDADAEFEDGGRRVGSGAPHIDFATPQRNVTPASSMSPAESGLLSAASTPPVATTPAVDGRRPSFDSVGGASACSSSYRPVIKIRTGRIGRVVYDYSSTCVSKCPTLCMLLYLIVACGISALIAVYPPELEQRFNQFMTTDVNASIERVGFMAARRAREETGRRLYDDAWEMYMVRNFYVAYESDSPIMNLQKLSAIAAFEQKLARIPRWKELCDGLKEDLRVLCERGVSVARFALPEMDIGNGKIVPTMANFNGYGTDLTLINVVLKMMESEDFIQGGMKHLVLPTGTSDPLAVTRIRSLFRWKFYCCLDTEGTAVMTAFVAEWRPIWKAFVKNHLLPFFEEHTELDGREGLLYWKQC